MGSTRGAVLYNCACLRLVPLENLLFCTQCDQLKCFMCISHEIESYFCPNCLHLNVTSAEVRLHKGRCTKCCQCPVCFSILAPVATDDRQSHYLLCGYCHWTSKEIGLIEDRPDKLFTACLEREKQAGAIEDMKQLDEYYKNIALVEKDRQRRVKEVGKKAKTRRYSDLKLSGPAADLLKAAVSKQSAAPVEAKFPFEIVAMGAEEMHDDEPDMSVEAFRDAPSLEQTFVSWSNLNEKDKLNPVRHQLKARLTKRCTKCELCLVKPEKNPNNTKFKMRLSAISYVPRITFAEEPLLSSKQPLRIELILTNMSDAPMDIVIGPEMKAEAAQSSVHFPTSTLQLLDETTAMLDADGSKSAIDDKGILWRKGNKLAIAFEVAPGQAQVDFQVTITTARHRTDKATIVTGSLILPGLVTSQ